MATYSEVKVGLDAVAAIISEQRAMMTKVKSNAFGPDGKRKFIDHRDRVYQEE